EDQFASDLTYQNFIDRLCQQAKIQVTMERPYCDGNLQDFRIHLVSGELTKRGPTLTLRRQKSHPWTFQELESVHWASGNSIQILQNWIRT
uniref:hypothetical protein n=1 Tax=Enterococcus faecium TaxID=1352 RepID=UPI003DA13B46